MKVSRFKYLECLFLGFVRCFVYNDIIFRPWEMLVFEGIECALQLIQNTSDKADEGMHQPIHS